MKIIFMRTRVMHIKVPGGVIKIDSAKLAEHFDAKEFIERWNNVMNQHGNMLFIDKKAPIEVINLSNKKKSHRATFAGVFDKTQSYISIGVAECSPKDQFNKKTGREKAFQSAIKKPFCIIKLSYDNDKDKMKNSAKLIRAFRDDYEQVGRRNFWKGIIDEYKKDRLWDIETTTKLEFELGTI